MILKLGKWLKEKHLKCKRQRWDFCKEFTMWHFAPKSAAVKFLHLWMSNHFSKSGYSATLVRPCVQNFSRKIGRQSPAGYTHGKRPRSRLRWSEHISDLACLCFGVEREELSEIDVTVRNFETYWGWYRLRPSPEE